MTVLKPSRSKKSTPTGVRRALGARRARAAAVEEEGAVGQPGERVVERLVDGVLDRARVVQREARVLGEGEQDLLLARDP